MKKILALILAMSLLLMCCACVSQTPDNNSSTPNNSTNSTPSDDTSSDDNSSDDNSSEESQLGSVVVDGFVLEEELEEEGKEEKQEVVPQTLNTKWYGNATVTSSKSDAEAKKLRDSILNAKNTDEIYEIKGKKYYVSPNGDDENDGLSEKTAVRTLNAHIFTMNKIKSGDAVLFERGGLWRVTSTFVCREGVTYGAYGKGDTKPAFYGSAKNYADPDDWIPSNLENVWKLTVADADVGQVVFNHGELIGVKKLNGLIALEENGDYYFNSKEDTLYVYYKDENPGKVFDDIEVALKLSLFTLNVKNVTIDNLCIKYVGAFGVDMGRNPHNTTITNCEMGFIGGSLQSGNLRYGNAIQAWNGTENFTVANNWIYQVYDAGITWQGDYSWEAESGDVYKNITFENNLVEYCTYSFEFWHANGGDPNLSPATVENFKLVNNISRFAGYGWGIQRPDSTGCHICVFQHLFPTAKNNAITGNIFDLSWGYMVNWRGDSRSNNGDWTIRDNAWYHTKNMANNGLIYCTWLNTTNQSQLEYAVSIFDTNPAKVEWIS
ncbi:MAG: hypothetical protein IKV81_07265 [Clostridia bacterium]|nr:hypothetical protein [Clostridia bacterium]